MIYLDHNATTPIAPEVREAMRPYLEREFGNPSSAHAYGATAKAAVDRARAQVAALLGSIAAATGSACHSGRTDPSTVLTAMGLDAAAAALSDAIGHG